jgi:adenylate cyclase class IV
MIEIEMKYQVELKPNFLSNLDILDKKEVIDNYYDNNDYLLLKNGNFLRNRNNKFIDFKLFAGDKTHLYCEEKTFDFNYFNSNNEEISNILERIGLKKVFFGSFNEFTKKLNLNMLAHIDRNRSYYKFENMEIVYDEVKDLGNFIEIEINVEDINHTHIDNKDKFESKLKKIGLVTEDVKYIKIGYVELYLKKNNPEIYRLGLYKG